MPAPSWCGNEYPPQGGAGRLSRRCYSEVRRGNELPKSKKKFSVTAYVDNNCSGSLPALDRNYLCVVEVPSVAGRCFTQWLAELGSILHDIRGYAGVPPPQTNNFGQVQADYQSSYYLHRL
jgi:hypothetical protein